MELQLIKKEITGIGKRRKSPKEMATCMLAEPYANLESEVSSCSFG